MRSSRTAWLMVPDKDLLYDAVLVDKDGRWQVQNTVQVIDFHVAVHQKRIGQAVARGVVADCLGLFQPD